MVRVRMSVSPSSIGEPELGAAKHRQPKHHIRYRWNGHARFAAITVPLRSSDADALFHDIFGDDMGLDVHILKEQGDEKAGEYERW